MEVCLSFIVLSLPAPAPLSCSGDYIGHIWLKYQGPRMQSRDAFLVDHPEGLGTSILKEPRVCSAILLV